jgi:dihydroxy-acid dehydratase
MSRPSRPPAGPLRLVRNGDEIRLDVAAGRIDMLVAEDELTRRAAEPAVHAAAPPRRGYAALFERCVLQADEGCDFDFLVKEPR